VKERNEKILAIIQRPFVDLTDVVYKSGAKFSCEIFAKTIIHSRQVASHWRFERTASGAEGVDALSALLQGYRSKRQENDRSMFM